MGFTDVINKITSSLYMPHISFLDIFEILIITYLIYKALVGMRNTRAMIVLKGILALIFSYIVAYGLGFQVIIMFFQWALTLAIFAIIVVFQKEIRKFLEKIGTNVHGKSFFRNLFFKKERPSNKRFSDKTVEEIADACFKMGAVKTGALIVMEGKTPLEELTENGIDVNGDVSSALLLNIFEKNTPLHDGAVLIQNDKVTSATCYLPLSESTSISKSLGTRHRAGIGISEITDCLVIVVSEETGKVSYIENGVIKHGVPKDQLISKLKGFQLKDENKIEKEKNLFKRFKNNRNLKILSFVIGFIIWLFSMNSLNPMTTIRISNVPVQIINEDIIEATGKTFNMSESQFVTVKITDTRSNTDKIKREDIIVTGDLSKLSYVYSIPLTATSSTFPNAVLDIVGDETMKINLEDKIDKEFIVEIKKINEDKNALYIETEPIEEKFIVSGAKSIIDTLDKVVVELDCSTITKETTTLNLIPSVYDKNGKRVQERLLHFNDSTVSLNLSYLPKKTVPLNVVIKGNNNINNVSNISSNPSEITIAGNEYTLSNISEVKVDIEVLSDVALNNGEYIKNIDIKEYLPKNTSLVGDSNEVTITIKLKTPNSRIFTFTKDQIELRNVNPNLYPRLKDDNFALTLQGNIDLLNSLTHKDVVPYIDLKDLSAGEYNLMIQINKIEGITLMDSVTSDIVLVKADNGNE